MDKEKILQQLEKIVADNPYDSRYDLIPDTIALIKEKEAVEPKCQIIFDVPYYFCGSCKTMLNMYAVKAKYCSNCARRVKWK